MLAHQPRHALAVHGVSVTTKFGMDPQRAVGLLVLGVDFPDLLDQGVLVVLARGTGRGAGLPTVVARARDSQHPAQPLHAEGPGVDGDEVPAAGRHFISLAK